MLSIIPPAVTTTILVAAVFLAEPRREVAPGAEVVADNMLRHHRAATAAAPATAGRVFVALPAPFAPIVEWQSAVLADSGGALWLLSWPASAADGARRVSPVAIASLPSIWHQRPPGTSFGRWEAVRPVSGTNPRFLVDGIVFAPAPGIPIPTGAPVLATRL